MKFLQFPDFAGCRALPSKAVRKLRSRVGVTMMELLVGMVIAVMTSAVVLESISFSIKYFRARSGETETQLLCEIVSLLVQDKLTNGPFISGAIPAGYIVTKGQIPGAYYDNGSSPVNLACYGFGETSGQERRVSIEIDNSNNAAQRYTVTVTAESVVSDMVAKNTFTVDALG